MLELRLRLLAERVTAEVAAAGHKPHNQSYEHLEPPKEHVCKENATKSAHKREQPYPQNKLSRPRVIANETPNEKEKHTIFSKAKTTTKTPKS